MYSCAKDVTLLAILVLLEDSEQEQGSSSGRERTRRVAELEAEEWGGEELPALLVQARLVDQLGGPRLLLLPDSCEAWQVLAGSLLTLWR